jgi:hypothetical protein
MASTGTHPAASMLFRIIDVPAERYHNRRSGVLGQTKTIQSITQSTVTIDAIGIDIFMNGLMVKLAIVRKLKIASADLKVGRL